MLQQPELEMLWNSSLSKHEAELRVIYQIFAEFATMLSDDHLNFFFTQMTKIPADKFGDYTLTLIQDYTLQAMKIQYQYKYSQCIFP